MDSQLREKLNSQVQEEFYSAYMYLAMAADCARKGFDGFENWMKVQAAEEVDHAMGIYSFLGDRGETVSLLEIARPPADWGTSLEMFEATLKHEKHITEKIHEIYDKAVEVRDYATVSFLKWYVDEQVEEENSARSLVDRIKLIGDGGQQMYMLDKELAARLYKKSGPYAAGE